MLFLYVQECSSEFVTNAALQAHARLHSRVCFIECPVCPRKFSDRYLLNIHIDKTHESFAKNVAAGRQSNNKTG
jgi:hypothetical protein